MSKPAIGMQFSSPKDQSFPVTKGDLSKVLVIDTSEDASESEFKLDTPVRFSSSDTEATDALGTGLLMSHMRGIQDQLTGLNSSADVTVVRTKKDADAAKTAASIKGVIDGIDQIPSAVNATPGVVVAGSTAYRADDTTASPVVAALEANLGKILAVAPVDVDPTTKEKSISAREKMTSGRVFPIGVAARVYEGENIVTRGMAARVAGLMVRTDNQHFGMPFQPICNRPIYGLAGLNRTIPFNFLDGGSEGQQMLEADVSIIAEGETGVYGSVADGGYRFIGTDMAGAEGHWKQLHQVRGTDYIKTQLIKITRERLGPKISRGLVEAWLQDITYMLRDLKAGGYILGYTPAEKMFTADKNSPENIRLGELNIEVGQEEASSFKLANIEMQPYRPAVKALVQDIINGLNTTV
ncbi:phage tail protein [Polycladidibacter hongkongensis]|uniref:phage tail protein n=1 Tax=Polycladidibacter hongkongensis TaxID=1647556 RepID=UPI0008337E4C|nr:phage tail protein [Pseudovibrio hongkongensis]